MRILVSTSFGSEMRPTTMDGVVVVHRRRRSDWGMGRLRREALKLREVVELAWAARRQDALIVLTAGPEVAALGWACRVLAQRTRLVVADPLLPLRPGRLVRGGYRLVHRYVVIRRRDAGLLDSRFGVPDDRVTFARWPGDLAEPSETTDGGYVYAAGWAHRDWPMFHEAIADLPARVVIAADLPAHPDPRVEVVGAVPPDRGRELMRAAAVVAMPLLDTDLPAGPLVLLDAMAAGKAVVATRTGGTVDYLTDGVDGVLVPPGDAGAFAGALRKLLENPLERQRLAGAAKSSAAQFTSGDFWSACYATASYI